MTLSFKVEVLEAWLWNSAFSSGGVTCWEVDWRGHELNLLHISVPAWMEEGPHDDILGVIDRNKFLWLQNHETDFIYACWFPACLRPLLLYFRLPLNSQQNCNHWTAVFFGSSHHILPAICEITDPVCTIRRQKNSSTPSLSSGLP